MNEEFIVFAYGKPDRLETGLCEGTKNLESAQEELKALGAGYEPSKITSPQEDQLEIYSINKETNNRFIIVLVLSVSLTVFILLVISLRSQRR